MNKLERIYKFIINEYGKRGAWISDIAYKLEISKTQANILTIAAGYGRGKTVKACNLEKFRNDNSVQLVASSISDDLMNRL